MDLAVHLNDADRLVWVIPAGLTVAGLDQFHLIGNYTHPSNDVLGWEHNHVLWHHVRDVMYSEGYENPALFQISLIQDGVPIIPTVPGPLTYKSTVAGELDSFNKLFTLASPDCIFELAAKYTGDPVITITHGGEPIETVKVLKGDEIILLMAVGRGLTIEAADVAIRVTGGSILMGAFRINEMKDVETPAIGASDTYIGTDTNHVMRIPEATHGRIKSVQAALRDAAFGEGCYLASSFKMEYNDADRVITGVYAPEFDHPMSDWSHSDSIVLTEEGWLKETRVSTGSWTTAQLTIAPSVEEATLGDMYLELDVDLPAGTAIKAGGKSGSAYPGDTLYGPYVGKVKMLAMGYKIERLNMNFVGNGATVKSVKVFKDAVCLLYGFGDGGPVDPETIKSVYYYARGGYSGKDAGPMKALVVEFRGDNFNPLPEE